MTRKRLFQIVIIIVAAVWIASAILAFGILRARKNQSPATTMPTLTTTAPTTTAPTTTAAAPSVTAGGNSFSTAQTAPTGASAATSFGGTDSLYSSAAPTQTTSTAAAVPSSKSAVIAAYLNAVNTLKNTSDFTLVKTEVLNVVVDEITPASVRSMANTIIESNRTTSPVTYRFIGGTDAVSGLSPNNVIAPIGRQASLSESAVRTATASPNSDGGYTLHLTFGRDVQTLNTPAQAYAGVFQTLDKEALGLPSAAKVDSFTVIYDNSSIDATVDSSGRLVSMTHHITVTDSEGHGSLVMAVTTKMHGDHTAKYEITY